MTESNHLCDLWEHTIVKVFKHDSKSELGLMFKQWIIFNKLENFNSILNYPIVRCLMIDSMLVGHKVMLVDHEDRTWGQSG